MTPTTRFAILLNAKDGTPTRHRFKESRTVRVKVPILADSTPNLDADENEVLEWRAEAAIVHVYECERTKTERVWGCDSTQAS